MHDNTRLISQRRAPGARRRTRWPVVLTFALLATSADAALWKWTDANGRIVYSDIPPSGDVKAERVSGPSAPANPSAAKDMAQQDAEFRKRQLQRTEDAAKAEKTSAENARRQ